MTGSDGDLDQREIAHFDSLAEDWWAADGAFAALHRLTPPRIGYIHQQLRRLIPSRLADGPLPFAGLRIADLGCGGGLLAEPLARLGAAVTAIDASSEAIAIGRDHARRSGLEIDFRCQTVESLAAEQATLDDSKAGMDVVIASEVLEHVADRNRFLAAMAGLGRRDPDLPSVAVMTTINRNPVSVVLAKYAAEYLFGLAPPGTHQASRFIRPSELRREAAAAGIILDDISGIRPTVFGEFAIAGPPLINYAAAGLITPGRPPA